MCEDDDPVDQRRHAVLQDFLGRTPGLHAWQQTNLGEVPSRRAQGAHCEGAVGERKFASAPVRRVLVLHGGADFALGEEADLTLRLHLAGQSSPRWNLTCPKSNTSLAAPGTIYGKSKGDVAQHVTLC